MAKKNKLFPRIDYSDGWLINQNGDITKAYALIKPPYQSASWDECLAAHAGHRRFIANLPANIIVQFQDRFYKKHYSLPARETPPDELETANDRYYDQRAYFEQYSYLFITRTAGSLGPPPRMLESLTGKTLIPTVAGNNAVFREFEDQVDRLIQLLQQTGVACRPLTREELMGTRKRMGLTEPYSLTVPPGSQPVIRDIDNGDGPKIGDHYLSITGISDASQLSPQCSPVLRDERYSTDKTCFPVTPGAWLGYLLPCEHIVNCYIYKEDRSLLMKELDKRLRRQESLGGKDGANLATQADVRGYREVLAKGEQEPVRMHLDIVVWTEEAKELPALQNRVVVNLTKLGINPHLETLNGLRLYASAIPGNAGDLPVNQTFPTFGEQAACFLVTESNQRDSTNSSAIAFVDRVTAIPVRVDLHDEPKRKGVINNFNKTIVAPSGSGKTVLLLKLAHAAYRQGHHQMIVDLGGSYKSLCRYLGGCYLAFGEEEKLQFNPFLTGDGEAPDSEKTESLITLLLVLWKMGNQGFTRSEYIALTHLVTGYYAWLSVNPAVFPCFDTLYEWMQTDFIPGLAATGIREKDFDWPNLLYVLRPYYAGGEYEHLLNARENRDLLQERFVVFELDAIRDHSILFPVVTVILMELYMSKLRKLKGVRKILVMDEAWKALMTPVTSEFVKYVYKTVRKFNGEAIVATQDIEDLIGNPIVKNAIINNADTKIVLDVGKLVNRFDELQTVLGLTESEKTQLLSVNRNREPGHSYREFFITQGNGHSRVYRLELPLEELLLYTTDEPQRIKVNEYVKRHGGLMEGIRSITADIRRGAVKLAVVGLILLAGLLLPNGGAKAQIIDIVDEIIKEALETADLKIQRLQTQTILLQNAEKALENTMAGDLLDDITGWVQQQEQLFAEYYGELWQVKSVLSGFGKVGGLIERQAQLVRDYQRVTAAIRGDPHFSVAEIEQMLTVYSGILDASIRNVQRLTVVITGSVTEMDDAGRLRIIDETAAGIDRNNADLQQYTQRNMLLSLQRAKDQNDIQAIKSLYGIR